MSPLLSQDHRFQYVPAANTDISLRIASEWERRGQLHPDRDPRVQRNRLRAQGFDLVMEARDAEMRRILNRLEAGQPKVGDIQALRNYMEL